MKKTTLANFLMVLIASSGCADVALQKREYGQITSVTVSPNVSIPDHAVFFGVNTYAGAAIGGLIGGGVKSRDAGPAAQLTELIRQNKIDVAGIVAEEFSTHLAQTEVFSPKINREGIYSFKLVIENYGLGKGSGFENIMRPLIQANASLVDVQGKIFWKKTVLVGGGDTTLEIRPAEDWARDPEGLKKAYIEAAKVLVAKLLKQFDQK